MDNQDAISKFENWFSEPIEKLKELPQGNGGFAAFIIGMTLYERLIKARQAVNNLSTDPDIIKEAMKKDLMLSDYERKIFWDMFRNGLMHQGLPKIGKTGYWFDNSFSAYPRFEQINRQTVICIDPWKFTDRIIAEFLANPDLLTITKDYPFPIILHSG